MKTYLTSLFVVWSLSIWAQAPVQNFTLTNVADGGLVSLEHYTNSAGIAILFTSNSCPYDGYYTERIRKLIDSHLGKIQFILINSHPEPEESIEKMKPVIDTWNFHAPYLADKDQVVMEQFGAKRSPEVFLLSGSSGKFKVIYHGAIDDNPQSANAVTRNYLKESIDKLLSKQPVEEVTTRIVGCTIRKK